MKTGSLSFLMVLSLVLAVGCWGESSQAPPNAEGGNGQISPVLGGTADAIPPVAGKVLFDLGDASAAIDQPEASSAAALMPIQPIGAAGFLPTVLGPTHFGPIYLLSAGYSFFYQGGGFNPLTGPLGSTESNSFNGTIVYQKVLGRRRIAVQYTPQLAITNGQFSSTLSNQNLSYDDQYLLSRFWRLGVHDAFSYVGGQSIIGNYYNVDTNSGTAVQNRFLYGSTNCLSNVLSGTLTGQIGPSTTIAFSPSFTYGRASQPASLLTASQLNSQLFGIALSLTHALDSKKSVGAFYSFQVNETTGVPAAGSTFYHSGGLTYSQLLSSTMRFTASLGVSWTSLPLIDNVLVQSAMQGPSWTPVGSASVVKSFGKSSVALSYSRSADFAGYVSNDLYFDRADVTVSPYVQAFRKLHSSFGVGYQRGNGQNGQAITGKYASTNISYALSPRLSAVTTYTHQIQTGDNVQTFSGIDNVVSGGLTWSFSAPR